MSHSSRQLAAILFSDIIGYTAMMQENEQHALAVTRHYLAVLQEEVTMHGGKVMNDYGDGSLCTFGSVTDAVNSAIKIQQRLQEAPVVSLRIGLHIGEIFIEQGKVMGDGVNIASRIQSLGKANSILFSKEVHDKLKNQPVFQSVSLGYFAFRNVKEPMEVFALANSGLQVPKRENMEGKLNSPKKNQFKRNWIIATILALAIVAGILIYNQYSHAKGFYGGDKTIAVLPFENGGGNDSEEYVTDGITQDIINSLSKINSLQKVIAWFSVKGFKKTQKPIKEIADELGVTAILTGTIQRQADNIHIFAELIDASTNKRIWGSDYNYKAKDLLSIQSTITGEIVVALQASLTPEEKVNISRHYTENIEAYKLYRKGRSFLDARTTQSFDSASANFKKALALDPDYALAYAGLADTYILPQNGLTQLEAMPIARDYATKALSLDSTLPEALTTMGFIQSIFDYDWVASKKTLEKAIRLNPNYPLAHMYYGNLLQYTGESREKGLNEVNKAVQLDPLSATPNWVLGRNYFLGGYDDSAYDHLKKTLAISPDYVRAKATLAFVLMDEKKFTEAIDLIHQIPQKGASKLFYYQGGLLSYAYAMSGDSVRARSVLQETMKDNPDQTPMILAHIYVALHDFDEAIRQLEISYSARNVDMYFLGVDPAFKPLRNDPRFRNLLAKMHLQ